MLSLPGTLLPIHAKRADKLVREYRDEVGRELERLVALAKSLGLPEDLIVDVIADVPYRLSPKEAEERLRALAGEAGRRAPTPVE